MRKFVLFILCLINISCIAQTTTPVWFKVAKEGDHITTTSSVIARYGSGTNWTASIIQILNTTIGNGIGIPYDPIPGVVKEFDIQETTLMQSVNVNGTIVVVPALTTTTIGTPAPIPNPPTITLKLTVSPVPVILNGTKYSCTSVVLDNTGTLTLTCP